ncbi:suppressor protein SRP40 [Nicotiana sylvestris]|uniref:Calmodulin-binding domain-containing protein n=2 Tax=Nicotiana TaxID=4085 RepID=A0A1S4DIZ0_TOBAC|nr:PREDICTED: uncharacterized protein LOC104247498 [Nicotiana sylvestris]XP_009801830.1 PREDICTED: uncharacterized protein LOC104247498 [Nicotiana sylvestris]XP_009801832.1 PREDICTED: uncharacterized protein LOC104247498 [Nicotiana sylvestris]XP_016513365.1 PREDICTED: uncharacterized protein LOC107830351 [Nicotiana tabacum]
MADMSCGIPENLEKIERVVSRVRRNSTGSLGFEMGGSKVLSRYLGVPTGSCHDMCKSGFEHDSPTKARIPRPTRCGATLGKIPERKKLPSSTKQSSEIKSQKKCQVNGQEIPTSTKRADAFVNYQCDSKLKPLEESASRRHHRRYSDIFIPGRSSKLHESLSEGSSSRQNHSCKMDKDGGSSELSKKKSVVNSTVSLSPKSSVKKVSSTTSTNNSPRKASQLNSRTNLTPSKTAQINHENVPKKTLYLRESKNKSHTAGIYQENSNVKESSLDRDSPTRGKTASSPFCTPSSPQSSGGSSSRNIGTTQSSISSSSLVSLPSTSANESFNSDVTDVSTRQTGNTNQKQGIKPQRRAGQVGLENEDCSPKMLKFKKGKTTDSQSEKDSSPRRLKYRQVSVQDHERENESGDLRGKGLKRCIADDHSGTAKDNVLKVNLRSQAIEDMKEAPSLFNNVIEVTASKLAETRRSKVKALVGAFETIISLQHPKSSPAIGRS